MKNTAKELEEENRDCKTKMADLDKRLKLCRDEMYDLNNTLNKSNKRNLMIQSESTANHKIGPKRPPKKPYSPNYFSIFSRTLPFFIIVNFHYLVFVRLSKIFKPRKPLGCVVSVNNFEGTSSQKCGPD